MIAMVGPSYALSTRLFATSELLTVLDSPFSANAVPRGLSARALAPPEPLIEPIPVPFLPGMDEVEVDGASLLLAGGVTNRVVDAISKPGDKWSLALTQPAGVSGALSRIAITGFRLTTTTHALGNSKASAAFLDVASNKMVADRAAPANSIFAHFMIRTPTGPPIAAAPEFAMPGAGGRHYGPALGGVSMQTGAIAGDGLPVTLAVSPPLAGRTFDLAMGSIADDKGKTPIGGLPTDAGDFGAWEATQVRATFRTRPEDVEVALVGPGTAAPAVVASFPGELQGQTSETDLTPALRAMAKAALAAATGGDLGLHLKITGKSDGEICLAVPRPRLRYIRRPMVGPEALRLMGAREALLLDLPRGLVPGGISFAIDGRYGLARLTDASPTAEPSPCIGYRLAVGRRIALPFALSAVERLLPLRRLAAHGRAEGRGELLLSLYRGDGAVPGERYREPVAVALEPGTRMVWHRAEWSGPGLVGPHPEKLWLVVEASHGVFLQAVGAGGAGALLAEAGGAQWTDAIAPPLLQAWVDEADPATGEPAPLHALDLHGPTGLLNGDIADVVGKRKPGAFALRWLALGTAHAGLMHEIAANEGAFALNFSCRRDVTLNVSDAALTYNPWTARV